MGTINKLFKSLPFRILIAIIAGVLLGLICPLWAVRLFVTFKALFGAFLNFAIPLIILGLVTAAIGRMGRNISVVFTATLALAYLFTVGSGLFAYFSGIVGYPLLLDPTVGAITLPEGVEGAKPYFTIGMAPIMDVTTALILAFIVGAGVANLAGRTLLTAAEEFETIVSNLISVAIVPLLPFYICSIFLEMTYTGQVAPIFMLFIKIIIFVFVLHVLLLVGQFCIAGAVVKRNPLQLLWRMMPAYLTALGTQSSAATIPFTLKQVKLNGVSDEVAGFVVPLCATIHLSGSTLKMVSCALALMMMQGIPYDFSLFLHFILLLGITMVAAPGVPGGAIMAAIAVLQSVLGFNEENIALMIALYITMDSFGTAANITGDGAIALIIDKIQKRRLERSKGKVAPEILES